MSILRTHFPLALAALAAGTLALAGLIVMPGPVQAQQEPTALPTPAVGARADSCEPNDRRERACALSLDTVAGPFTFLPAGDQDWYRAELGEPDGLETTVVVRSSGSLELLTSISRDDGTPITSFSSPTISTTLAADIGGPVIIRVENRSPDDPTGSTYGVELRKTLPPPPPPQASQPSELAPDGLENNWSPATAAPIAVGEVYDLNFVCPVVWGCEGGDHDYLALPVKAGTQYLIATFDLGPGVDTVIDLFWGSEERPLIANDDARPGGGFLSVLRWHAPADGVAILRVAPRNGSIDPTVADPKASTYRFAVALSRSDLAEQLEERIAEQTNAPTATPVASSVSSPGAGATRPAPAPAAPAPAPAPAPAAPAAAAQPAAGGTPQGDSLKGEAMVLRETVLRTRPDVGGEAIQTLAPETVVTLLGKYQGLWVRAQTSDAVIPGWLLATDLRRLPEGGAQPAATSPQPATAVAQPTMDTAEAQPSPALPALRVEPIEPLPQAALPEAPVRVSRSVSVTVVVATQAPVKTPTSLKATPVPQRPIAGVRVQLVNAFGDVLAEAVTPANGPVILTREVDDDTALFLRLPAVGIEVQADQPEVQIAVPTEREL